MDGIEIDTAAAVQCLMKSPSTATALLPYVGYNKAVELAGYMKKHGMDIYEANSELRLVSNEKLMDILKPENLIQGVYRLTDLTTE